MNEANTVKHEIGAAQYIEISSKTQDNLKNLFDEAIRCARHPPQLVLNIQNNNNNQNNGGRRRRECKCECDWKEVANNLWQLLAFLVATTVYILIDIFALIVAFNQYDTNDDCWNDLDELWLHPSTFLMVGGLASIIGIGLGMLFKTVWDIDEERQDVPRLCLLVFFCVWAIMGYVLTAQIGDIESCNGQSIGKMTIAWSVVKNIEFCCGSLDIVVNIYRFHNY